MSDLDESLEGDFDGNDADKRAHHNALERKRRDHIKDSFSSLRDSVPSLHGEKASRAQILKKAADYIQTMRRKNTSHQQDIDDLKKQNKVLEEQIVHALEKSKSTGFTSFGTSAMLEKPKSDSISSLDGISDSEDDHLAIDNDCKDEEDDDDDLNDDDDGDCLDDESGEDSGAPSSKRSRNSD